MEMPEMDQQRVMENTYIPWDNSKTKNNFIFKYFFSTSYFFL
jgi:hypothetical protein